LKSTEKSNKVDSLIESLKAVAAETGVNIFVVASHQGKSALSLAEALGKGSQVISVTEFTYSDDLKKTMKKLNVLPVERVDLPIQDMREMRETLLMFGSGVKAALEVSMIVKSKGLVKDKFIAVAGSGKRLDTALLMDTIHPKAEQISNPMKRMMVKRFIAMP
jgi:hypothetical protein